ncbi:MAG: helix-turn-helix domain-containing protein [Fimbriimonas sp.]
MDLSGRRFEPVNLSLPPDNVLIGSLDYLRPDRIEFIQPRGVWTIYYYHHENALTVNALTYPVMEGTMAIAPPGARVAHAKVGQGTKIYYMTFDMPGKGPDRGVVPHVLYDMQSEERNWVRCMDRLVDTVVHLKAYSWNLMCLHSQNMALFRSDQILFDAEAWILGNLSSKITVADVAREVKVSPRHLLRAFREQHDLTVQEYIIRRRVREAGRLLVTTDLQPKAIAAMVGIHDLQQFNKLMRVHTGASPRRFRSALEAKEAHLR